MLFLDVDGVITVADGSGRLCEDKLERLERVVMETGTQIVISSNWRHFPQLKTRLVMALHEHGGMRVVGCTPDNGERVHGDAVSRPWPPWPSASPPAHPTLPSEGSRGGGYLFFVPPQSLFEWRLGVPPRGSCQVVLGC